MQTYMHVHTHTCIYTHVGKGVSIDPPTPPPPPLSPAPLQSIFSFTSLQAVFLQWWVQRVEGGLGMPDWVHRSAGTFEACIVCIRLHGKQGWWPDVSSIDPDIGVAVTHILTCGLIGGALWTWTIGCKRPIGVIPGILVVVASSVASDEQLARVGLQQVVCLPVAAAGSFVARTVHNYHNRNTKAD
jgi:hypothetical protein